MGQWVKFSEKRWDMCDSFASIMPLPDGNWFYYIAYDDCGIIPDCTPADEAREYLVSRVIGHCNGQIDAYQKTRYNAQVAYKELVEERNARI